MENKTDLPSREEIEAGLKQVADKEVAGMSLDDQLEELYHKIYDNK